MQFSMGKYSSGSGKAGFWNSIDDLPNPSWNHFLWGRNCYLRDAAYTCSSNRDDRSKASKDSADKNKKVNLCALLTDVVVHYLLYHHYNELSFPLKLESCQITFVSKRERKKIRTFKLSSPMIFLNCINYSTIQNREEIFNMTLIRCFYFFLLWWNMALKSTKYRASNFYIQYEKTHCDAFKFFQLNLIIIFRLILQL